MPPGRSLVRNFWQDVRYGLRLFSNSSCFAAIAILTLALGIGANTALFSVVNGVLLNPLPFPNPDALLSVYAKTSASGHSSISYPNFLDWHKDNSSFSSLGAFRSESYNLTGIGEPERLNCQMVSAEFLPALGVPLPLGRNFRPEEDQAGAAPVALLGDRLWKRKFASSPDVLGKSLTLNGKAYTVIGVAPSRLPVFSPTDVYVSIAQWPDPTFLHPHISIGMNSIRRIKPGVTFEQARAAIDRVGRNLEAAYPDSNKGPRI